MFKKLYFKYQYLSLYLRKNLLFFVLGIGAGSLLFVYHNAIFALVQSPMFRSQYYGLEGLYTTQNLPEDITGIFSLGLTVNSENDKPLPSALVDSMETSSSNKDFVFHLKKNLYWHNGKKFTAYDINYSISGLNFQVIDNNTIKITSQNDFSPTLSLLSKPLFLKDLVGLGPYRASDIQFQDGYIKSLTALPVRNNQPEIIYRFYPNEKDLITAFKLGEVDEIDLNTLPSDLSSWSKIKTGQTIQTNKRYIAIFLNTDKFNNKQFRQALAYATPKTADKNERCLGPIAPTSWAYNPFVKEYNYNPSRAKELLDKNPINKINLAVNNRKLLPLAENIKNAWRDALGINTTITIENQVDPQNFDAVLAYGGIPHDPDQYLFWHSTQAKTNITHLNNSRIDKLLEDGRKTLDPIERKQIYQDFQKFLLEESPAIFLSYPTTYTVNRIK